MLRLFKPLLFAASLALAAAPAMAQSLTPVVSKATFTQKTEALQRTITTGSAAEIDAIFVELNKMANDEYVVIRTKLRNAPTDAERETLKKLAVKQRTRFAEAMQLKQAGAQQNYKEIVEKLSAFAADIL